MAQTFKLTFAVSFFMLGLLAHFYIFQFESDVTLITYGAILALVANDLFGKRKLPRMPPDHLLTQLEKFRNDSYPELRIYTAIRLYINGRNL